MYIVIYIYIHIILYIYEVYVCMYIYIYINIDINIDINIYIYTHVGVCFILRCILTSVDVPFAHSRIPSPTAVLRPDQPNGACPRSSSKLAADQLA